MLSCAFFGNRDTPSDVEILLNQVLLDLIENKKVQMFYVGNNGAFDAMVRKQLKEIKGICCGIDYAVVLAYMPPHSLHLENKDYLDTIYPYELAGVFPKYAIVERNKWMINKADFVVTYVRHDFGGAARFKKIAEQKGKTIIELSEIG